MSESQGFDRSVDLLVVGSGAGAMTAAVRAKDLGADVLMIEKTELYGGSSAMSGGSLWIPCNHLMKQDGIVEDTPEEALEYLSNITEGLVPEEKLRKYIDESGKMLSYMHDKARLNMFSMPAYADYYAEVSGGKPGARACEPHRFDARLLGDDFYKMREPAIQELVFGRMSMTATESKKILTGAPGYIALSLKIAVRYFFDIVGRFKSHRDRSCALGNALIGQLRLSMLDRNIPLWLESPFEEFIVEGGRVVGAVVSKQGKRMRIESKKGVVLAAGGFESNDEMRKQYLPNPTKAEWTCANPGNTGEVIQRGQELGAGVGFMDGAWWGPVTTVPGEAHARMLVVEKGLPRSMMVNSKGERFLNESAPYDDICKDAYRVNSPEAKSVPCWFVFDDAFRKAYPVGPLYPGMPVTKSLLSSGYMKKADTIRGLAEQIGVDPNGLEKSVEKMAAYARDGKDPEFSRGEGAYERYYGDATVEPNPCLGPIDTAPFYAIEIYPGDLGTRGGLEVDADARVLKEDGSVIEGLYAVGNCSAAVMGPTYPGAGGTIGPAMTFGFVVAENLFGNE
ncbi:MAG: FAD-binding protein [Myxococcota bacterium]|jgi:3-oxosteroid 1-dehydrogenase|nr:FAD-binding protein [Myxococcota bacterium]